MSRVAKVRRTFPKSTMELIGFARSVLMSVAANPTFLGLNNPPPTTPVPNVPAYTEVSDAVDALEAQHLKVILGGTKADTSLRNDLQEILDAPVTGLLVLWANYVEQQSRGDVTAILSSGFKLVKQPESVGALGQPENFKVEATAVGTLKLSVDPMDGAYSYQWELQLVGSTDPKIVRTTPAATITITNLQSTKQYNCCVVAVGTDQTVVTYSGTITSTVL